MDSLDDELQSLSKKDNSDWTKFTPLVTGVGNCVFISTTVSFYHLKEYPKKKVFIRPLKIINFNWFMSCSLIVLSVVKFEK